MLFLLQQQWNRRKHTATCCWPPAAVDIWTWSSSGSGHTSTWTSPCNWCRHLTSVKTCYRWQQHAGVLTGSLFCFVLFCRFLFVCLCMFVYLNKKNYVLFNDLSTACRGTHRLFVLFCLFACLLVCLFVYVCLYSLFVFFMFYLMIWPQHAGVLTGSLFCFVCLFVYVCLYIYFFLCSI